MVKEFAIVSYADMERPQDIWRESKIHREYIIIWFKLKKFFFWKGAYELVHYSYLLGEWECELQPSYITNLPLTWLVFITYN